MREIETFYLDKHGLNTGYIFFDNYTKIKKTMKILNELHIPYFKTLYIVKGNKYFGFKIWNINKRLIELMTCLKEVL